jgi:hypothetical protein
MRTAFRTPETLVAAYWRKLASSIRAAYRKTSRRGRESALSRKLSRAGAARRAHQLTKQGRVSRNGSTTGMTARHATH